MVYVDLSEDDEALILATLDPIAAMAGRDDEILRGLVADLPPIDNDAIRQLLDGTGSNPMGGDEQGTLNQQKQVTCPNCGSEFGA